MLTVSPRWLSYSYLTPAWNREAAGSRGGEDRAQDASPSVCCLVARRRAASPETGRAQL